MFVVVCLLFVWSFFLSRGNGTLCSCVRTLFSKLHAVTNWKVCDVLAIKEIEMYLLKLMEKRIKENLDSIENWKERK